MKCTIKIFGKEYSSTGNSVLECLDNLEYKGFARTIAMLTIKDGKDEKTVVLPPRQTQRLFSASPLAKEIAVKQTAMRFPQYVSRNNI